MKTEEKEAKVIQMFNFDKLLNSSESSQSEDEDPNQKFKSAIVFNNGPILDCPRKDSNISADVDFSPKNAGPIVNIKNHSSSKNLLEVPSYHNDGQSTHVSSRASCHDIERSETNSQKQLRSEMGPIEKIITKDSVESESLRSPSLESA
jgi:hypothetical protein